MNTTLDKEAMTKAVEDSVGNFVHEQLISFKIEFDKIPKKDLLSAQAIDDLRDIQCLIDEARKAEANIQNINDKIDVVLEKVTAAISSSKRFLEKYKREEAPLLKKVINDLNEIISSCKDKLDLFGKKLKFIKESLTPITKLENLKENSPKQLFGEWAEAFELFTEGLEEGIEIFEDLSCAAIENFAKELLSLASKKSYNSFRKDKYKRRLKFSAHYILNLIQKRTKTTNSTIEQKSCTEQKNMRNLLDAQYNLVHQQIMQYINIDKIDGVETEEEILSAIANFTR